MSTAQLIGDRRYRVNGLIKGAAAVDELRTLLLNWSPEEGHLGLRRRVVEADLLGKATATRARDMITYVFKPRLLTPTDAAARHLKLYLQLGGDPGAFRELLLLYEARAEAILYDFIVLRYWPARATGELWLRPADAAEFLDKAKQKGLIVGTWSDSTRQRTAHALIAALAAFGFVSSPRSEKREIVPFRATDLAVAYLAHDLHFAGLTDADLVDYPDWAIFGLDRGHLLERLEALGPQAGMLVQRAGSVVRISWTHQDMEAVLHALIG